MYPNSETEFNPRPLDLNLLFYFLKFMIRIKNLFRYTEVTTKMA